MSPERIARIRREAELRAMTLRQLREEAGMTQTELADLAESTQAALSRVERREDNRSQRFVATSRRLAASSRSSRCSETSA